MSDEEELIPFDPPPDSAFRPTFGPDRERPQASPFRSKPAEPGPELFDDEPSPAEPLEPAPCPPQVRALGILATLLGATLPALAVLAWLRFPEQRVLGIAALAVAALSAALLLTGGIAFLARARFGRIPLAIVSFAAWPAAAALSLAAATLVADHGAPVALHRFHMCVWYCAALFSLVLGFSLLFGRIAAWGDGIPAPPREGPSTGSTSALLSMIFSFVPPYGAMQVASLILGTLAIGRIRRARGALRGRGQAIAGLCVSGGLLLLACLGVGTAGYFVAARGAEDGREARQRLRELAVVQRMYGELDWDGDGRNEPCLTTLTELLNAAEGRSGVPIDADHLRMLRGADYGVRGDRAFPVGGYVFRLERWDDVGDRSGWEIKARPMRGSGHVLRVGDVGEPWESGFEAERR